ncbi:MAG: trypsin-like peptidase domain-containing protein [Armatimonadota bacterium]
MSRVRGVYVLLLLLAAWIMLPFSGSAQVAGLEATQNAFRQIHAKLAPAVVSITSRIQETNDGETFNPFGAPSSPRTFTASGSGVIIRADGIILTNSHVVNNATRVNVTLTGRDKALPAEVVQTDPRTDLAIVRITETGTYPTAALGDATKVQVGDWAIAFGSPFRLASTMTVGVISATGRTLPSPNDTFNYRDLLQTDASINPGNSGGPLVNINGDVIGINFMIYSPGEGGSVGIGFAIPVNDYTRRIITTMTAGRAVERGQLGVGIKDLDDAMRQQYGVKEGGVLVDQVAPGKAAEKAGIKEEDVIILFNGVKVTDTDQLVRIIEQTAPGTTVPVVLVREKKQVTVNVTVGSVERTVAGATTAPVGMDPLKVGMEVASLTQEIVSRYNLPVSNGVFITRVFPDTPAAEAELQRGDIILRVGGVQVKNADEFWAELGKGMKDSTLGVVLRVRRGQFATSITLPPLPPEKK